MAPPFNASPTSYTPQEVDAWLLDAQERLAQLHLQVARPGQTFLQQDALIHLFVLLQEAFEEVRVMSAQSREESQAVRAKGQALCEHSAHLLAQSAAARERFGQFTPPPPEALREAESPLLETFKHGRGRKDEREP